MSTRNRIPVKSGPGGLARPVLPATGEVTRYLPRPHEWDTSALPDDRRAYLDAGYRFDEILSALIAEAEVIMVGEEPCEARPPVAPPDARRVCFRIKVSPRSYDLFYNAPDGLRGRYWQGADIGDLATRQIIDALAETLIAYFERHPPSRGLSRQPMSAVEVRASLAAASAKVWVRERDDAGSTMISHYAGSQLSVQRWKENEFARNDWSWRWTPLGEEIEIKGAFLSFGGDEYVPESKRDRSCQIHFYGFT